MNPAETAKNEAARQAVMLAFGVVGLLIVIPLYRRLAEQQAAAMRAAADPSEQAAARMRRAQNDAKRWDRLQTVFMRYGPQRAFWWAHDRAERARRAYDAERP